MYILCLLGASGGQHTLSSKGAWQKSSTCVTLGLLNTCARLSTWSPLIHEQPRLCKMWAWQMSWYQKTCVACSKIVCNKDIDCASCGSSGSTAWRCWTGWNFIWCRSDLHVSFCNFLPIASSQVYPDALWCDWEHHKFADQGAWVSEQRWGIPGMVTLQGRHLIAPSNSIPFLQFIWSGGAEK